MEGGFHLLSICVICGSSSARGASRTGALTAYVNLRRAATCPLVAKCALPVSQRDTDRAPLDTDRVPLGTDRAPLGHRPCPNGTSTVPHWDTHRAPRGHRPCPIGTPIVSQWYIDGVPVGHPQCPRGSAALLEATTVGCLTIGKAGTKMPNHKSGFERTRFWRPSAVRACWIAHSPVSARESSHLLLPRALGVCTYLGHTSTGGTGASPALPAGWPLALVDES